MERKGRLKLEVKRWKLCVSVILKVKRCCIGVGVKLEEKWWSLVVGVKLEVKRCSLGLG